MFVRARDRLSRNHACMTCVSTINCRPFTLNISSFDSDIIHSSTHEDQALLKRRRKGLTASTKHLVRRIVRRSRYGTKVRYKTSSCPVCNRILFGKVSRQKHHQSHKSTKPTVPSAVVANDDSFTILSVDTIRGSTPTTPPKLESKRECFILPKNDQMVQQPAPFNPLIQYRQFSSSLAPPQRHEECFVCKSGFLSSKEG